MAAAARVAEDMENDAAESEEMESELEDLSDDEEDVELPAEPGAVEEDEDAEW